MDSEKLCEGIYQIGGAGFSSTRDCCVYLLNGGGKYAIVDCGTGANTDRILENTKSLEVSPQDVEYIILTHGHIDHTGGLGAMLKTFPNAKTIAHILELPAIEQGIVGLTAADWYGIDYAGVKMDLVMEEVYHTLELGQITLSSYHSPQKGKYCQRCGLECVQD